MSFKEGYYCGLAAHLYNTIQNSLKIGLTYMQIATIANLQTEQIIFMYSEVNRGKTVSEAYYNTTNNIR